MIIFETVLHPAEGGSNLSKLCKDQPINRFSCYGPLSHNNDINRSIAPNAIEYCRIVSMLNEHDRPNAAGSGKTTVRYVEQIMPAIYRDGIAKATKMWLPMALSVCHRATPYAWQQSYIQQSTNGQRPWSLVIMENYTIKTIYDEFARRKR